MKKLLGDAIIDGIVKHSLIQDVEIGKDDDGEPLGFIVIWAANTAEVLEHIVEEFNKDTNLN